MGVGEAVANPKAIDGAVADALTAITGQKPLVTRATKSIAVYKLREGMQIGAKVNAARRDGCTRSSTSSSISCSRAHPRPSAACRARRS